ncbi:unnamed protein product, partial [Rotaria sp. Silwood1]
MHANALSLQVKLQGWGLIEAHNQFKATLGEAGAEYKNIIRLVNDARQTCLDHGLELTPNPYTNIQPD